eukprot:6562751-Pyramimonas_sp.AAC.1
MSFASPRRSSMAPGRARSRCANAPTAAEVSHVALRTHQRLWMASGQVFAASGTVGQGVAPTEI